MARRRRKSASEVLEGRQRTASARAAAGVEVDDRAFRKGFQQAVIKIQLQSVRDLVRLGLMTQNEARKLCPVDTGRLRASIMIEQGEDAKGPYVKVGSNVVYAPYVEFGTSVSPAQPYLRPAFLLATRRWVELARARGG